MSDIDTAAADSLKVLDPERPIREADIAMPCGRTDITIRNMDRLRQTIVESASLPAARGSGNGSKQSAEVAAADVSVVAK